MTRTAELLSSIRSAAPELLGRKPSRVMAKAEYALKEDVEALKAAIEELIAAVRKLRPGTQEAAAEAAERAAELDDRLDLEDSQIEDVAKMAVPEGRVRIDSYVKGLMRELRGTPPRRPDPFRIAAAGHGQRKKPLPIDEEGVRRALEQHRKRREDVVRKPRAGPSSRGTLRERAKRSEALEEDILRQIGEQQRRRLDLFGRKLGV